MRYAHRFPVAANRKMLSDPDSGGMDMPFDGKRMIRGGFTPLFEGN